eukprot:CAMPEP_0172434368 /NCGR_PEP_ID=MMETSP1064-20121228/70588_1 /TAXON_ID=202472 /ORGANISM="Aulacoseira subarctica , Strain CCAP 1002/5" /LENGTH=464 /DNA_ID=CAMNT_0013182581 /DNA_START=43 /DNA_END=1438 /DNA_ORIENTATION=+
MSTRTPIASLQPSSTLVNISENADVHLIHLLTENAPSDLLGKTFAADCEGLIANANAPGLLQMILKDDGAMTSLFNIGPQLEDCVSAFLLLASLIQRIPSEQDQSAVAAEVAEAIYKATKFDAVKRIAMLAALYNLRVDGVERCRLLEMLVKLASSSPELNPMLLEGQPLGDMLSANYLQKLMEFWNVPVLERRNLYHVVAHGISSLEGSEKRKQRLFLLFLDTYTQRSELDADALEASKEAAIGAIVGMNEECCGNTERVLLFLDTYTQRSELDADALEASKEAAIGAIRDPVTLFVEQRTMLSMPAILALADSPATKPLLVLLEIFAKGKLKDYEDFVTANGRMLEEFGLSKDECIRHMRLLSLCSLAAEHEEIPYGAIASTLNVNAEDVEKWVIDAVSSGLISAKMDQLQRVVMVERCVVRSFGMEQWQALQVKLNAWKKSVKGVLEGLKQSQIAIQEGNL